MLPPRHRLRRRSDFTTVIQRGRRGSARRLVVHVAAGEDEKPVLVGFVVSRAVGGAVVRNRVKRRLRGLVAERLDRLPPGSRVVVRALPPSAEAPTSALAEDLDHALRRATLVRGAR